MAEEQHRDNHRFDASQYAFFGENASQDFELGGLDEEEDADTSQNSERKLRVISDNGEKIDHVDAIYDSREHTSDISESMMKLGLDVVHKDLDHEPSPWVSGNVTQQIPKAHPNFLSQRQWEVSGSSEMPPPVERPHSMSSQAIHNRHPQVANSQENGSPFLPHLGDPFSLHFTPHLQHGHPTPLQGQWAPSVDAFMQDQVALQNAFQGVIERQMVLPRSPFPFAQQTLLNPFTPTVSSMNNSEDFFSTVDAIDYQLEFQQRNKQTFRSGNSCHRNFTRPQFRSKYMSVEEIENIARIQLASVQNNDSYTDDYYHLAVQAKLSGGSFHEKFHFSPSLRNSSSNRRSQGAQRTFAPSNGLGRVSLSSPQRPRQLLEVDNALQAAPVNLSDRPLEQEPMLAARIAIEDGLCLLLDIDDIDRILLAAHLPDGGNQLRWQRQVMLEGLAASLQLVDPTNSINNLSWREKNEKAIGNDFVFLHLVSLTKGRKLVYRYLQLLPQESQLVEMVCMAVFRHLRFLFGVPQTDLDAAAATSNLAQTVANCTNRMDLQTITSCLAAVLSSEPPPLRPFGSASGDGASLILRSALDRATHLLTDPRFMFSLKDREVWQAHFDDFFVLLYKYCTSKFDHILHSLVVSSSSARSKSINSAAAGTMSREMPIEILQASLPHMSEHQRMSLLDFTQRSMALGTLTSAVPG